MLKNQINLPAMLDITTGKFEVPEVLTKGQILNGGLTQLQLSPFLGAGSSKVVPNMLRLDRILTLLKQTPPCTRQRYALVAQYFSGPSGFGVQYDPESDEPPTISWTDMEGNMDWVEGTIEKFLNKDYTEELAEQAKRDAVFAAKLDTFFAELKKSEDKKVIAYIDSYSEQLSAK